MTGNGEGNSLYQLSMVMTGGWFVVIHHFYPCIIAIHQFIIVIHCKYCIIFIEWIQGDLQSAHVSGLEHVIPVPPKGAGRLAFLGGMMFSEAFKGWLYGISTLLG